MKIYLICFIASFILCFMLTALILPLLKKLKAGQYILGYVKEHKDKSGTPTMGGLAFVSAIIIAGLGFCGLHDPVVNLTLTITAGFALVGFLDDFLKIYRKENEGLKPYQKIIFQSAIAIIAASFCYFKGITKLNIPFVSGLEVDISWGIIPLVIFIFIATVNCVNLTDGLDGLAGGTSSAYFFLLGVMLAITNDGNANLCFIAVGAICAFLLFNVNKAKLFMGDTGSLALGGLISCVSIFSGNALYIPIFGIMFVISGITVIIQVIYYKRTKRRVFLMTPIHHHFQMKGYTECAISYAYFVVTLLLGIISLIFL
jgi:phospho-N-acetylmuramoyl-pentapeptide-transferase